MEYDSTRKRRGFKEQVYEPGISGPMHFEIGKSCVCNGPSSSAAIFKPAWSMEARRFRLVCSSNRRVSVVVFAPLPFGHPVCAQTVGHAPTPARMKPEAPSSQARSICRFGLPCRILPRTEAVSNQRLKASIAALRHSASAYHLWQLCPIWQDFLVHSKHQDFASPEIMAPFVIVLNDNKTFIL